MNYSIKTFTIVNLLLAVSCVIFTIMLINLSIEHDNFSQYLDLQLKQYNQTINAILDDEINAEQIHSINEHINYANSYENDDYRIEFIVWNRYNVQLTKSPGSPHLQFPNFTDDVFHDIKIQDRYWRVFINKKPNHNLTVATMYHLESRIELEKNITRDGILTMLLSLPLFAVLIWYIVNLGLKSITQTTNAVKLIEPHHLQTIHLDDVPYEIIPLIDQLNQLFVQLHNAIVREKQFADNAAHELKTPLAAIKMHVHAALHETKDESVIQYLNNVLKGVDRSEHQIKQLLVLSTTIPDSLAHESKTVVLSDIIVDTIADLIEIADLKHIKINFENMAERSVNGYPAALAIVINNLIINAIKYSDDHTKVKVVLSDHSDHQLIEVIDEGPGLTESELSQVFQRFYRVTGNKVSGSGLGLNIVKQIVDLHKGEIMLKNKAHSKGLIASVKLPIDKD